MRISLSLPEQNEVFFKIDQGFAWIRCEDVLTLATDHSYQSASQAGPDSLVQISFPVLLSSSPDLLRKTS